MINNLEAFRMAEGDFTALLDIPALLDDSALFAAWASRVRSLEKSSEKAKQFLAACVARGHPTRLREAIQVFGAAGFFKEAREARAQLPHVASAYLTARLADATLNISSLAKAIYEAEAVGLSLQAARALLVPNSSSPLHPPPVSSFMFFETNSIWKT